MDTSHNVIPEINVPGRTMDMIFFTRQLQEKYIEHHITLYQVFVNLTKTFDTANNITF